MTNPWVFGSCPGRPPRVALDAARLPAEAYLDDRVHLVREASKLVREDIWRMVCPSQGY